MTMSNLTIRATEALSNYTLYHSLGVPEYTVKGGTIRAVFKILLLVLVLFIALVGNWCLSLWVKKKLLQGKVVRLNETAGWIYGPSLAKSALDFRTLPGGWLGWLMIIVTILDQVADYGVAISVTNQLRWEWWTFPSGGIVTANTTTSSPSPNWEAFRWAAAAQANNYYNSNSTHMGIRHYGIYRMLTNDTSFMASSYDELGYWYCSKSVLDPLIFDQAWKKANYPDADEIYDADIATYLYNKGFFTYNTTSDNISYTDSLTGLPYGPATHTTILGASDTTPGQLFNISAAVDVQELDDQGGKAMMVFQCTLHALDEARTVEAIARVVNIQEVLDNWLPVIYGAFYPGLHSAVSQPTENIAILMEYYLNAMIMVSGVGEDVQSPNTQSIPVGVVYAATSIPYWIVAIFAIILFLAVGLFWFAVWLKITTHAAGQAHDNRNKDGVIVSSREIMENTPFGLMDWMAHAAYTSRDADKIPERPELKSWAISTTWHAGRRLGIVKKHEINMVDMTRTPSMPMNVMSPGGTVQPEQTEYFGGRKGDYISLNTREVPPQ